MVFTCLILVWIASLNYRVGQKKKKIYIRCNYSISFRDFIRYTVINDVYSVLFQDCTASHE